MICFRPATVSRILTVLLLGWIFFLPPPAWAAPPHDILILHSYHPELRWTKEISEGIAEIFRLSAEDYRFHTEYLDTKRNPSRQYLSLLAPALSYKLAPLEFDLILASDNDALNFVLDHRHDLFPGIPVVFCGVNDFQPQWIAGDPLITGVAEEPSVAETFAIALRLHPETREVIIVDSLRGPSDRAIHHQIETATRTLPDNIHVTFWSDLSATDLAKRVGELQPGQILFLGSTIAEGTGKVYSYEESLHLLRQGCKVPIYGFWDFFLGEGIVGGQLVSGFFQGEIAASLALRILAGEEPASLPVVSGAANRPLFDALELRRFAIDVSSLPEGSTLINTPPSFYPVRREDLWLVIAAMSTLTTFTLLLLWSRKRRRKAEADLRIGEERLRLALEGSQDALWDWDATTGRNIVDERWCSMLGYKKDEIEEHMDQWQTLVHPDDLPNITSAHRECMEGRIDHFAGEFRMRTKSGEWKWILGSGKVVARDPSGRPLRLAGTHKDISRQKEAELSLQEALAEAQGGREKIDTLLKSIADGLVVSDPEGKVTLFNRAATELLGLSAEEILGRAVVDIIPDPSFARVLKTALHCGAEESAVDLERSGDARGGARIVLARCAAICSRQGQAGGVVTILQDVTRAREKERLKSEFISTAAHELNTPLTVMLGFTELLRDLPRFSAEEQREYLGIIADKTVALARIVEDLLDLSRIESGRLITLRRVDVSLEAIILPLLDQYRRAHPGHRFSAELPTTGVTLPLDPEKIRQVLENLLSNAVKYSPKGGSIRISAGVGESACRIVITDEGIGMTEEQLERIFDKFYRANNTGAVDGLGLGMPIVRNIVEAHGGSITVASRLDRGTEVSLSLPLHPPETPS